MKDWVEVKSFSNQFEAELAQSALESVGIKSHIQVTDSSGGPFMGAALGGTGHYMGMLPTIIIFVSKAQFHDAQKLLN